MAIEFEFRCPEFADKSDACEDGVVVVVPPTVDSEIEDAAAYCCYCCGFC